MRAHIKERDPFARGAPPAILEPELWAYVAGDARRVAVIDPIDGRVIRRVGWRTCMCCPKPFFSRDVVRNRICDYCKSYKTD